MTFRPILSGILAVGVLLVLPACGKKQPTTPSTVADSQANPSSQAADGAAVPAPAGTANPTEVTNPADVQGTLGLLTDAVRKYCVEQRKVPSTIEEVIAAGYIRNAPAPPPGKKFAINSRREVILANR